MAHSGTGLSGYPQWGPDGSPSSLGMLGPLPRWSTGFRCMERPPLPMSHQGWSWHRGDRSLLHSLHGNTGLWQPPCSQGSSPAKAPGRGVSAAGERQATGSSCNNPAWLPAPNISGPWRTEVIREKKDVMETPRPDDAVSPGKPPQQPAQHTIPAPGDAVPSHGPSAKGSMWLPASTQGDAGDFTSSCCFLVPPSPILLPSAAARPQVCKLLLSPQLKLSPPQAQSKRQLSSPCSNHSEGAPAPAAPARPAAAVPQEAAAVPEQELCHGQLPAVHPHSSPGGLQAHRENKTLGSTLKFTQLTQKCNCGAPYKSIGCPC